MVQFWTKISDIAYTLELLVRKLAEYDANIDVLMTDRYQQSNESFARVYRRISGCIVEIPSAAIAHHCRPSVLPSPVRVFQSTKIRRGGQVRLYEQKACLNVYTSMCHLTNMSRSSDAVHNVRNFEGG